MVSEDSYNNNSNSIKTFILREQIQQITQHTNTEVEELKNEFNKLKIEFIRDSKHYNKNDNSNIGKNINKKENILCQICEKQHHRLINAFRGALVKFAKKLIIRH